MNREEFDELQSEFGDYVYRYEYFLKCGYMNDFYYNAKFRDDILHNSELELENSFMNAALNGVNNPNFKLEEFLEQAKKNKKEILNGIEIKQKKADEIIAHNNLLTDDEKRAFENEYLAVIKKYHPVVRCFIQEEEKQIYENLRKFYNDNNILGFREFLELNKSAFKEINYAEDTYSKVALFYYQNQKSINADFTKKQNVYPFNKNQVFKDEISVSREQGELKVNYSKLFRLNQDLKKKYKEVFQQDFEI